MKFRNLILTVMIVALFCVPSFAIQDSIIPADDAVFNVDVPTLTANVQAADLQENPTADIVGSFDNDFTADLKSDDNTITPRGSDNSCSIRAVTNLSTVGTYDYEEMFTIMNLNTTDSLKPNYNNASSALDNNTGEQENHAAILIEYGSKKAAVQNNRLNLSTRLLNNN